MIFGQVFNVRFPQEREGSEVQGKGEPPYRPCVVISANRFNEHLTTVIVAPLTSKVKNRPWRSKSNIKGTEGEVMLDQIMTISKSRLETSLGNLSTDEIRDLKIKLKKILDLG